MFENLFEKVGNLHFQRCIACFLEFFVGYIVLHLGFLIQYQNRLRKRKQKKRLWGEAPRACMFIRKSTIEVLIFMTKNYLVLVVYDI